MKPKLNSLLITIIFVLTCQITFGQSEEEKAVMQKFVEHLNAQQPDSVFALFDANMKEAMPPAKTKEFLSGLHRQLGSVVSYELSKHVKPVMVFKTGFEKATFNINLAVNEKQQITGLYLKPYVDESLPKIERNITKLVLPFKGEWFTFWGGEHPILNYHVNYPNMKGAFDFVIKNKDLYSYEGDKFKNENYYCFGKEITAPCDALVFSVLDGIEDNVPGKMNPSAATGNTVVLETVNKEFIFLCHFKQNSIVVKEGQKVKKHELLGLCGNSGNSSEAHLHFHIQNSGNFHNGIGAKCYFGNLLVNDTIRSDYMPQRGERVSNVK